MKDIELIQSTHIAFAGYTADAYEQPALFSYLCNAELEFTRQKNALSTVLGKHPEDTMLAGIGVAAVIVTRTADSALSESYSLTQLNNDLSPAGLRLEKLSDVVEHFVRFELTDIYEEYKSIF